LSGVEPQSKWRERLSVVRRRWPFVLGPLLVVVVVAGVNLARTEPQYEASSQVLISRADLAAAVAGTPGTVAPTQDFNRIIQTQVEVASSPVVRERTLRRLGLPTDEEALDDRVSVVPKPNSDILTISVRAGERDRAVELTNEYARQ